MESLFSFDLLWLSIALKLLLLLGFFLVAPLVVGYMEHKVLAHMQARLGPMEAGRFHGIGQLPADGVKFLQKEDIIPRAADKWVFSLAPGVALIPALVILAVVPMGPGVFAENLDAGIFFALAVSSVSVLGVLMAAWSSANKYSLMGGIRAAAQLIAYELPLVLAAAAVVVQAGTLSLSGIVEAQATYTVFGVPMWFFLPQALGLFLFYVAALAELNRPPFDMPIADSEIIFGHMTEYTGIRYAFFMLAEYAGMVVLSALATVLFLGGWYILPGLDAQGLATLLGLGDLPAWVEGLVGFAVTFGKIFALTFVMVWLRATFPRLREDQLQRMSWLVFIPLALLNILVVAVAKVLR
ncbi:MAG: complex I subunit 1/NuoH family protein [Egibacteraceae bacterium]